MLEEILIIGVRASDRASNRTRGSNWARVGDGGRASDRASGRVRARVQGN